MHRNLGSNEEARSSDSRRRTTKNEDKAECITCDEEGVRAQTKNAHTSLARRRLKNIVPRTYHFEAGVLTVCVADAMENHTSRTMVRNN